MPTYDYECDACGHTYELFQNISTLKQDGIYKILKGDCDLKQVMAVCIV